MLTGGCLCGQARFEADGEPVGASVCHCRMCQRAHAAPMVGFASFPRSGFRLTRGELAAYASSDHGTRRFCPTCGSQLIFDDSRYPDEIDIALCSLDDPDAALPRHHIWTGSQRPWVKLDDSLPAYPERSPQA